MLAVCALDVLFRPVQNFEFTESRFKRLNFGDKGRVCGHEILVGTSQQANVVLQRTDFRRVESDRARATVEIARDDLR